MKGRASPLSCRKQSHCFSRRQRLARKSSVQILNRIVWRRIGGTITLPHWPERIGCERSAARASAAPDATMQPTLQDNQLMSKHRVLSFKPQLRLEWRGQDGQNETEQSDHSASLGDSITSSTQIRFSVHTLARQGTWGSSPKESPHDRAGFSPRN